LGYNLSEVLVEFGAIVILSIIVLFALGTYWSVLFPRKGDNPLLDKLYIPVKIIAANASLSARFASESIWLSEIYGNCATLNVPAGIIKSDKNEIEIEFLSGGKRVLKKKARIKFGEIKNNAKMPQYDICNVYWSEDTSEESSNYISLNSLYSELSGGDVIQA
jgi:hypothetical protein